MNRANILAKVYFDKCDIYRSKEVKDGSITHHNFVLQAKDVLCRLSQGMSRVKGENISSIDSQHKLFAKPEVDILKGDELYITQQGSSKVIKYIAGEPFRYHESHIEVELSRNEYE